MDSLGPRPLHLALGAVLSATVWTSGCGQPPGREAPLPTPRSSPTPEQVTVTGTVTAGVEPGCLVLDTGTMRYLLLDGDRSLLEPDRRVTVSGIERPGKPTTCMEGVPLQVTDIRPAS